MNNKNNILIGENSKSQTEATAKAFSREGHYLTDAKNGSDGLHKLIDLQSTQVWKETLNMLCKNLRALSASTEKEFISTGADLNGFYEYSQEISKTSSSFVSSFSETELMSVIESFRDLLDHMNDYIKQTESGFKNGTEVLQDIYKNISNIYKPVTGFKKIIKTLRILSISTKIESSQLNHNSNGFVTIAEEVERLATLIQIKFTDITSSAELVKKLIEHTLIWTSDLETRQGGKIKEILDSTRATLEVLTQKNESSSQMARKISAELESISKNMEEVVAYMQFHDITRQQVEHVEEALQGVYNKLDDDNQDMEKVLQETGTVCEVQKAQLVNAKEKFTRAVSTIMDSLKGISFNISAIDGDVRKLAGTENESSLSFFSQIESGVFSIISSLRESIEAISKLSAGMDDLGKTVVGISQFVNDVGEISSELELIAMNARIKAAHTGEEGAPLGVIAEAIHKLSIDARIQKTEISDELQKIASSAEFLHLNINTNAEEQAVKTESMLNNLNSLTHRLGSINETILSCFHKIQKEGQELADGIDNTVSDIQVHYMFAREIDRACSVLNSIISEIREIMPEMIFQEDAEILKCMEIKYTMQSEREIHESLTVFHKDGPKSDYVLNHDTLAGEDFGENVELF
jgi:methyl-accepting chemotaxis protein